MCTIAESNILISPKSISSGSVALWPQEKKKKKEKRKRKCSDEFVFMLDFFWSLKAFLLPVTIVIKSPFQQSSCPRFKLRFSPWECSLFSTASNPCWFSCSTLSSSENGTSEQYYLNIWLALPSFRVLAFWSYRKAGSFMRAYMQLLHLFIYTHDSLCFALGYVLWSHSGSLHEETCFLSWSC